MKKISVLYFVILLSVGASFAQQTTPPLIAPVAAAESPAVVVTPAPVTAPVAAVTGPEPVPAIIKDESMAPPIWMQDIVVQAKSLPIVGPYIVKFGQIVFFILTVLTALTAALTSILAGLKSFSNAANLGTLYERVVQFQHGKIMYWLKYTSLAFNAQKPKPKPEFDELTLERRA